MMKAIKISVLAFIISGCHQGEQKDHWVEKYNVVWNGPSTDPSGQMPLGNGDIAAGVYAIEDDALYLLLSKNDALTYNGDIFKTGRVKIGITPNPFEKGRSFRQTLDLRTGSILIEAEGLSIRVWADAHHPLYHVEINSPQKISVTASADPWKRFDNCGRNRTSEPLETPTQDVILAQNGHILSYYAVGDRSVYPAELKYYEIEHMAEAYPDPFRFNTFGNLLESPDLDLKDGSLSGSGKQFDIRIHAKCSQEPDIDKWIADFEEQAEQQVTLSRDWKAHCRWWEDFWKKSRIMITDNTIDPEERNHLDHEAYKKMRDAKDRGALVAQSYNVFRFLMACQSRGRIQTKFNGGLFTLPLRCSEEVYERSVRSGIEGDWTINGGTYISCEDQRLWGRRYTHQNQRLLYWPLLMSGDLEMMHPFFNFYADLLPLRRAVCKAWFGHEGAYFRENMELTGGERDCAPSFSEPGHIDEKPRKTPPGGNTEGAFHHSYYFTAGLETLAMMINYAKYSENKAFCDNTLVPFAREILTFYDQHYLRDEHGKLRMDPSQALETWWGAVNPSTDIAGLLYNLDELLSMEIGTEADQDNWKRFREEIPEVHLHEINGGTAIAPAREWWRKRNAEIPELYPLFPFTRFSAALGSKDIAEWTMGNRVHDGVLKNKCWAQQEIGWAYAGNAREAREGLIKRFSLTAPECRFILFGGQFPDSCPDFDHFGSGSIALQRMLVQEAAGKIHLLPAWPADWDTDFRLHLSGRTVIRGKVQNGKLIDWSVYPESRKKDVVVHQVQ